MKKLLNIKVKVLDESGISYYRHVFKSLKAYRARLNSTLLYSQIVCSDELPF